MDSEAFAQFLKVKLIDAVKPVENNILNLVSQGIDQNTMNLSRLAGYRDMMIELLNKLDPLLRDFHDAKAAA